MRRLDIGFIIGIILFPATAPTKREGPEIGHGVRQVVRAITLLVRQKSQTKCFDLLSNFELHKQKRLWSGNFELWRSQGLVQTRPDCAFYYIEISYLTEVFHEYLRYALRCCKSFGNSEK